MHAILILFFPTNPLGQPSTAYMQATYNTTNHKVNHEEFAQQVNSI